MRLKLTSNETLTNTYKRPDGGAQDTVQNRVHTI